MDVKEAVFIDISNILSHVSFYTEKLRVQLNFLQFDETRCQGKISLTTGFIDFKKFDWIRSYNRKKYNLLSSKRIQGKPRVVISKAIFINN